MGRILETATLDAAARDYAAQFALPTIKSLRGNPIAGRGWALNNLYNARYKDEFEYLLPRFRDELGKRLLREFDDEASLTPRTDEAFEAELRTWLAIDPDGNHIKGAVGKTETGVRPMGAAVFHVETPDSIRWRKRRGLKLHGPRDDRETMPVVRRVTWPIYAGEDIERAAGNPDVDSLELGYGHALVLQTRISAESAIGACDAIVDRLDEGSTAASIRGRTGTQPLDPDDTESGTLLFTLQCSDPAFGAAADTVGEATATADPITDDASADATNTLTYCRAGATGTGADDHIDGSAGTGTVDFVFNTAAIVSGSTVSMTSWTFAVPQTEAG